MQNTSRLFWVAFLSTCLGIGLFRFSYTSLMPLLVEQKWFTASFASYLSSANLLGYLIGALLAHAASRYIQDKKLISISAFLGSLSLLLCAIHGLPEFLYIVFRLFSGIAGATLMVLAPSYAGALQISFVLSFLLVYKGNKRRYRLSRHTSQAFL